MAGTAANIRQDSVDRQRPAIVLGEDGRLTDSWTCRHFSLSNATTDDVTDLPRLLRRVAAAIEEHHIAPMELSDVVIHSEITDLGPYWSATVYWSPGDRAD